MKPKLPVMTFGLLCFAAGFFICYLLVSQRPSASRQSPRPVTTKVPAGVDNLFDAKPFWLAEQPKFMAITNAVVPSDNTIHAPDQWQWPDGTVQNIPPPGPAQRDLGLIETRP
ncbi:MAG TPA: hypothetical protein VLT36_00525 [Candidatus Dormibacteraeota bacterium]|nr:hypothetical protein [Candidatus Dormibacteraeota bacterium]